MSQEEKEQKINKYSFCKDGIVMLSQYRQYQDPLHTVFVFSLNFWLVEKLPCGVTQLPSFGFMLSEWV